MQMKIQMVHLSLESSSSVAPVGAKPAPKVGSLSALKRGTYILFVYARVRTCMYQRSYNHTCTCIYYDITSFVGYSHIYTLMHPGCPMLRELRLSSTKIAGDIEVIIRLPRLTKASVLVFTCLWCARCVSRLCGCLIDVQGLHEPFVHLPQALVYHIP